MNVSLHMCFAEMRCLVSTPQRVLPQNSAAPKTITVPKFNPSINRSDATKVRRLVSLVARNLFPYFSLSHGSASPELGLGTAAEFLLGRGADKSPDLRRFPF